MAVTWGHPAGSVARASHFSSGHGLVVCKFKPHVGLSAVSKEPASDPLSPPLPHLHAFKNKHLKKVNKTVMNWQMHELGVIPFKILQQMKS